MIGGVVAGTVFNHMDQTMWDMQVYVDPKKKTETADENDADNRAWKKNQDLAKASTASSSDEKLPTKQMHWKKYMEPRNVVPLMSKDKKRKGLFILNVVVYEVLQTIACSFIT